MLSENLYGLDVQQVTLHLGEPQRLYATHPNDWSRGWWYSPDCNTS